MRQMQFVLARCSVSVTEKQAAAELLKRLESWLQTTAKDVKGVRRLCAKGGNL
jgi:hypothetical protein